MNYKIICHDGKSFEITEEQNTLINKKILTNIKGITLNGNFIFFSNVARIEKTSSREYKKLPEVKRVYKKERHIKNLNSMKLGFLNGVSDRNNLKKNQRTMLEKIDMAIQAVIKSDKTGFIIEPKKIFGY